MKQVRKDFPSLSENLKVSALMHLTALKYVDKQLISMACQSVIRGEIKQAKSVTNLLYAVAKSSRIYKPWLDPANKELMSVCSSLLLQEPVIAPSIASRNLWNYSVIGHKDEKLFDKLSGVLIDNRDLLQGIDVSNALTCYADSGYLNAFVMESLIKVTIRDLENYSFFTLGNILLSFAKLDIRNPTLFAVARAHILRVRDRLENPGSTEQEQVA